MDKLDMYVQTCSHALGWQRRTEQSASWYALMIMEDNFHWTAVWINSRQWWAGGTSLSISSGLWKSSHLLHCPSLVLTWALVKMLIRGHCRERCAALAFRVVFSSSVVTECYYCFSGCWLGLCHKIWKSILCSCVKEVMAKWPIAAIK